MTEYFPETTRQCLKLTGCSSEGCSNYRASQAGKKHTPFRQTPLIHLIPHPPKLLGSFVIFVPQQSAYIPLQSAKPGEHATITQVPPEQLLCCTFGALQTLLHVPQLLGSFVIFVSQPSAYTPLQSIKPGEHT